MCIEEADTEVAFMGIADDPKEPFHITRLYMPEQNNSTAYVEMEEDSISAHMLELFQKDGIQPNQCARVWIHTHPSSDTTPSGTDETTFKEFLQGDWCIMLIVGTTGKTTCRIKYKWDSPFGGGVADEEMDVVLDWENDFPATDMDEWIDTMHKVTNQRIITISDRNGNKPGKASSRNAVTSYSGGIGYGSRLWGHDAEEEAEATAARLLGDEDEDEDSLVAEALEECTDYYNAIIMSRFDKIEDRVTGGGNHHQNLIDIYNLYQMAPHMPEMDLDSLEAIKDEATKLNDAAMEEFADLCITLVTAQDEEYELQVDAQAAQLQADYDERIAIEAMQDEREVQQAMATNESRN